MKPTRWKLYTDGEDTWQAMIAACEKAEHSIDLEQYIFVNDEIGKKIIDVCVRKAAQGVHVRFLWDAAGSFNLFGSALAGELRTKGIDLVSKLSSPVFSKSPIIGHGFSEITGKHSLSTVRLDSPEVSASGKNSARGATHIFKSKVPSLPTCRPHSTQCGHAQPMTMRTKKSEKKSVKKIAVSEKPYARPNSEK